MPKDGWFGNGSRPRARLLSRRSKMRACTSTSSLPMAECCTSMVSTCTTTSPSQTIPSSTRHDHSRAPSSRCCVTRMPGTFFRSTAPARCSSRKSWPRRSGGPISGAVCRRMGRSSRMSPTSESSVSERR